MSCRLLGLREDGLRLASPVVLDADTAVAKLLPMSMGGNAFVVRDDAADAAADEYYLLENRQQTGWDSYVPGSGLTITHVDYDEEIWWNNIVNDDPEHPRMGMIPASGVYTPDADVAYPYLGNDSLTDNSTPAASVYNINEAGTYYMGKPITGIRHDEAGGDRVVPLCLPQRRTIRIGHNRARNGIPHRARRLRRLRPARTHDRPDRRRRPPERKCPGRGLHNQRTRRDNKKSNKTVGYHCFQIRASLRTFSRRQRVRLLFFLLNSSMIRKIFRNFVVGNYKEAISEKGCVRNKRIDI